MSTESHTLSLSLIPPRRALVLSSTMSDPHSPPPAYDLSEQDYDRKTNDALLLSTQPQDDEWETWDDTVHASAARQLAEYSFGAGTSSAGASAYYDQYLFDSSDAIQPLNIHKKAFLKDKPSWLAAAGLEDPGSSSMPLQSDQEHLSLPNTVVDGIDESGSSQGLSSDDEAGNAISPPPFATVDPGLDTTYQESAPMPTYYGNNSNSNTPSPLTSPVVGSVTLPAPPPLPPLPPTLVHNPDRSSPSSYRQSLPMPRRYPSPLPPRPVTTVYNHTSIAMPPVPVDAAPPASHMPFDPSVAYHRKRVDVQPVVQLQSPPYESFYNSAVTPYLAKKKANVPVPVDNGPRQSQFYRQPDFPAMMQPASRSTGFPSARNDPQFGRMPAQTQYQSYANPAPIAPLPTSAILASTMLRQSSYSASRPAQPDPMSGPGAGGQAQGPWASSEHQMMWDVYSTPR